MKSSGLTLLEMIFVLVLIGVAMGIFLMRTGGVSDEIRLQTATGDLAAIKKAIQSYYLNYRAHGSYSYPSGSDWQNNDLINDSPRVLRQILYDPFRASNTEYSYYVSTNGKYYVTFSYGPNKNADITGIGDTGTLSGAGAPNDDIYVTNGS